MTARKDGHSHAWRLALRQPAVSPSVGRSAASREGETMSGLVSRILRIAVPADYRAPSPYGPTRALIVTSHDPSAFCVAANMPPVSAPLIAPSTGTGTGAGAAHCR